jgi:hypothetical protein
MIPAVNGAARLNNPTGGFGMNAALRRPARLMRQPANSAVAREQETT